MEMKLERPNDRKKWAARKPPPNDYLATLAPTTLSHLDVISVFIAA